MRLFLNLVLIWALLSLGIGLIGAAWLDDAWRAQVELNFRRVVDAAGVAVREQTWQDPPESDPQWRLMERRLGVTVIPLVEQVPGSISGVRWSRSGVQGMRVAAVRPVSSHEDLGFAAIQVEAPVPPSPVGMIWWSSWGLLSGCTYILALVGWWTVRREARLKRRLLQPWFRALQKSPNPRALLPHVEPLDTDFSLQMDAVANSVNRVYAELKSANDRSELVLGNLREGVLAVDDRFRILLANKALRRLLDLPDENYLLRPLLEVLRTPLIARLAEKMVRENVPAEEQVEFGTGPRHLRILARPLPFGGGRTGALITVRDETMLKRVDLIKRDFVANASHELKTPLAAIRAYAETLQMGALDDREMAERFVSNIISQADRMDGLVQGMLQLSRVEVGTALKFQRFDAVEAIESCTAAAQALGRAKGVRIDVHMPDRSLAIRSDRDGFQTIASNLLSNGVRYTDSGGTVTVRLSETPDRVVLEVADTGIGMSSEDLERVFERFYRAEKDRSAHTGGTGLGLSIVKHLTQALGGKVHASSRLGEGSCFVVELPKNPSVEPMDVAGEDRPNASAVSFGGEPAPRTA
jgi:two-component system, OmpR family, phosphate regulon sensor histidine kinase PhoR